MAGAMEDLFRWADGDFHSQGCWKLLGWESLRGGSWGGRKLGKITVGNVGKVVFFCFKD